MRQVVIFLIVSWFINGLHSQDLPEVIPPAPTAAALGKYGDIPVSQYTGVPNISIPLYQIQSRDISVPISLNYHAGGIKVEEEASWVGLGWSLNAGGVVSRSVRGLDDLSSQGYPFDSNTFPASDSFNNYSGIDPVNAQTYFDGICNSSIDAEPDLFYFNFGSYSGKFVLQRGSSFPDAQVLLLSQAKIKIETEYASSPPPGGTSRFSWKITTPDGFQYYFQEQEVTEMRTAAGISEYEASDVLPSSLQANTVNSWFLTEILSPTGESVTLSYDDDPHLTASQISITEERRSTKRLQYYRRDECIGFPSFCDTIFPSCETGSILYSGSQRIVRDVYLERIDFTNGHVEFETENRNDMEIVSTGVTGNELEPQRLKEIRVYIQGNLLRSFSFSYDYFHAGESSDKKRLKLLSLTEFNAAETKPPYEFTYYEETLPAKNSKSQDYWGFYNGKSNHFIYGYVEALFPGDPTYLNLNTLIPAYELTTTSAPIHINGQWEVVIGWDTTCASQYCDPQSQSYDLDSCYSCWNDYFLPSYVNGADRRPDQSSNLRYMTAGSLKELRYPTGGLTRFTFEKHDYGNFQDENVERDTAVSECGPNFPYSICPYNSTSTISLTEPAFVFLQHIVNRVCTTGTCSTLSGNYGSITGPGTNISFSYDVPDTLTYYEAYTYHYLQAGTYTLSANGIDNAAVNIEAKWMNPTDSTSPKLSEAAGGLRIKSITTSEDTLISSDDQVTEFIYTKWENGVEKSSGRLMAPLKYEFFEYHENPFGFDKYVCHNFVQSTGSHIPLGSSAQGSSVGYDEVTVLHGQGGINGKTVYHYFNTEEKLTPYFFPNLPNRTFGSNGMLGLMSQYAKTSIGTYQKVTEVENHYNDKRYDDDLRTYNPASFTTTIEGVKIYGASCGGTIMPAKFYDVVSEWWRLTKSINRTYDQLNGNQFTETTIEYSYDETDGSKQLIEEKKTDVHGVDHISIYSYPANYDDNQGYPWIDSMKRRHMHNIPIEVLTKTVEGSDTNYLSGIFNEYAFEDSINASGILPGAIVPSKTLVLEIDESSVTSYSPSTPIGAPDSKYKTRILFETYDEEGNLLQVKKESGQPICYLYGHQKQLPIAQVINAESDEVAYCSFEAPNVTADGNWTIINGGGIWQLGGKTGLRAFELPTSSSRVENTITQAADYVVSLWYTGSPKVTAGSVSQTLPNASEWTYWEESFSLSSGNTVKVERASGVPLIDELRLFPSDAQMSSICYDENLRVQCMTDANGRSSYYSYDGLGRLQYVQDQDGNYVQQFTYHLKDN